MTAPLVLPLLVLAAVLGVSGVAKIADREATADMFTSLEVPIVPPALGALLLPYAEIVLAVALLVTHGSLLVVVTAATLALLTAYWLVIAQAMRFDPPVSCSCFGRLGGHRVDGYTLARNTLLMGLAVVGLVGAARGVGVWRGLADFTTDDAAWLGLTLVTIALGWLVARGVADPTSTPGGASPADGDYVRTPIPYAVVEDVDGIESTLRTLSATRARLLVVLSPGCSSCLKVAARLDGWAERLGDRVGVHAVYEHDLADLSVLHDPSRSLRQRGRSVSLVLGMDHTPAAVLLGADGLLAGGPVVGATMIEQLVDDMVVSLAEQP